MGRYVIDTCSVRELRTIHPEVFPTFWEKVDEMVSVGALTSVREVRLEIQHQEKRMSDHIMEWVKRQRACFSEASDEELEIVQHIMDNPKFNNITPENSLLRGSPLADPFLIARAKSCDGIVITEEKHKDNSCKIPTICAHYKVACLDLTSFLKATKWRF